MTLWLKIKIRYHEWLFENGFINFFELPWIKEFIEKEPE